MIWLFSYRPGPLWFERSALGRMRYRYLTERATGWSRWQSVRRTWLTWYAP